MKNVALFFGALLMVFTFSCKKKNLKYVLKGTITDSSFNVPLSGARVTIYVTTTSNSTPVQKASLTTDASGNYSYELDREKFQNVILSVEKENYFSDGITTTLDNLSIDHDNVFNYGIYAKSWARIHFVSDGTKIIKYFKQAGKNGCAECCPTGEIQLDNLTDYSVYCINNGNAAYQIYYDVQGTTNTGSISVVTVPFDTTEILINY
ncbi:carboxypeptidase-like regulatory domain-containing protein [Fluviicola chungangensis]|uniref:Carboxypeptidase regulatory-like domain-containing protein n=1 Tax=Fluviicola chungangensis TaxID=2597671 RepID=A0A556N6A6_9FLAO|nr:carboxypeptidase-like regulatory domain-containing protein [Fluviicola chungangensis]TSJ47665.1 carboxypeptidase regulatory-like domain-containing protein [Fluviicola chungangensis]